MAYNDHLLCINRNINILFKKIEDNSHSLLGLANMSLKLC